MTVLGAGLPVHTAQADVATNATNYAVTGVFQESRSAGKTAIIAHNAIAGYMGAMTMPFNVKSPAELDGLQPGDKITFRLFVTDTDAWIEAIKKTGERASAAAPAPTPPVKIMPELQTGDLLPDGILTNQSGRPFHLTGFRGRALAFTFFYSRCPLPTFCPLMNSNLAAVQKALLKDSVKTNWQLLSISFDPDFDTPAKLADYAARYQSDPQHWNFATGSPEQIRTLGGSFGLMFWSENGTINHNLRTVIVDPAGRVQKVFTGNEWQPDGLTAEMKRAMEIMQ
jgi:protein SCO1/2